MININGAVIRKKQLHVIYIQAISLISLISFTLIYVARSIRTKWIRKETNARKYDQRRYTRNLYSV